MVTNIVLLNYSEFQIRQKRATALITNNKITDLHILSLLATKSRMVIIIGLLITSINQQ